MDVTLLYFDDCPNWHTADDRVRAALAMVGVEATILYQVVETQRDAEHLGFNGSPTVLIDGVDPFADPGAVAGLACRVYRTQDGLAGAPSVEELIDAFHGALSRDPSTGGTGEQ